MKKIIMIVLLTSGSFAVCPSYTAGIKAQYCLAQEANKLQAEANDLKREEIKKLQAQNDILKEIVKAIKESR